MSLFRTPSRRTFLAGSTLAAGALSGAFSLGGAAPASARNTDTVRLTFGPSGGLTLIAKERGAFEKALNDQGLKVEWVGPFPNHAPTLQAVMGGSADFSFGGSTTPAFAAISAGSPLVFTQFLVYRPRTTSIIARQGSGIEQVQDLVGKSVAVNRSGLGEFLLVAALEKYGVDRSKVNVVYLNPPDAAPALASGKVDAWSMWSPGVDIARAEYKAHDIFVEERDLDFQIDFTTWLTSRAFATENADIVRLVNAGFAREAEWASANPQEAETIAQGSPPRYSDAVRDLFLARKRRYEIYPVTDEAFIAQLQKAADWLVERKVLPEKVTVTDLLAKV
ncbi:sulfonate transport system substrate-binding protein [Methylopila capsulata]|uniref:ABC transporter substrate-binding protein n=1 Tax=Methylopila capsulata TaxID=61654 RepID=A0A9W6IRU3_9HYPH|nr:NrtA/SsuA/CpmA family ABC transporter substrate-binding protein [Methylopila capsulata]MBM7851002.1 sulfonate transport system substrate-binding protein [Methylopila capsulata]GLK54060.1 ABC transporter substrate-binding protein [Methylopila capsulata]